MDCLRWAKIYGEWTVVDVLDPDDDGERFMMIGDDCSYRPYDFSSPGPNGQDYPAFEWGPVLEPPTVI
jgi:hypothetical protein